jgi:hypothetical protein
MLQVRYILIVDIAEGKGPNYIADIYAKYKMGVGQQSSARTI